MGSFWDLLAEIKRFDPESVRFVGEFVILGLKAGGKVAVKSAPAVGQFCIACVVTSGAFNEAVFSLTGNRPLTQLVNVARANQTMDEVGAIWSHWWYKGK